MEPGDLRESPAGSGESDVGEWREVILGGDVELKAAECNEVTRETARRDTREEDKCEEKQKGMGEKLHSPYEEELDPRIQVWENLFVGTDLTSKQGWVIKPASGAQGLKSSEGPHAWRYYDFTFFYPAFERH